MFRVVKKEDQNVIKAESLDELIEICRKNNLCIGFDSATTARIIQRRYMVVLEGPAIGLAVRPDGTWHNKDGQSKIPLESYSVFETQSELFDWMSGKAS